MNKELESLMQELEEVKACKLEYLPKYGFSSKEEVIRLIKDDLEDLKDEIRQSSFDYTDEELENERTAFTVGFGISRFC